MNEYPPAMTRLERHRELLAGGPEPTIDLTSSVYAATRTPTTVFNPLDPHDALVRQPQAFKVIFCPCTRCTTQRREEYALAKQTVERDARLEPLPDSLYPEAPTKHDRDVLDILDMVAKVAVVLIAAAFIFACYHAYATGAVERMLSR